MLKKIVITGGDGRFAQILKRDNKKLNILYPNKKELNILDVDSIKRYLKNLSKIFKIIKECEEGKNLKTYLRYKSSIKLFKRLN